MSKILVLQGPPASGKSTFAREFVKDKTDWVIVSRDSLREARGQYWIPEQEDYISDLETFSIRSAIDRNLSVIIDATNLNPKTINKWKELAETTQSEIEFKEFYVPFREAKERDKNRERPVGEKVLKRFYRQYYSERLFEETIQEVDNRLILEQDENLPKCVIVDIDGTLALNGGRSPYDKDKVLNDKPNTPVINLIKKLFESYVIFFFSGREGTEQCFEDTKTWLRNNVGFASNLYMRKAGDYRADEVVKKELYDEVVKDKYQVVSVFDDRNKVVDMWRSLGLLCCQVYYGNF